MQATAQGGRFAVGSLDAWLRAMNVDNPWCNPKLKWQEFIRMAPAVPLVTLKPNETEAFFQHRIEYFLAACRRVMHQNVVYEMLANPILGHLVATVGAPNKTGGTRVWGDFRLLPNKPSKSKSLKIYLYNCVDRFLKNLSTKFAYIVRSCS